MICYCCCYCIVEEKGKCCLEPRVWHGSEQSRWCRCKASSCVRALTWACCCFSSVFRCLQKVQRQCCSCCCWRCCFHWAASRTNWLTRPSRAEGTRWVCCGRERKGERWVQTDAAGACPALVVADAGDGFSFCGSRTTSASLLSWRTRLRTPIYQARSFWNPIAKYCKSKLVNEENEKTKCNIFKVELRSCCVWSKWHT